MIAKAISSALALILSTTSADAALTFTTSGDYSDLVYGTPTGDLGAPPIHFETSFILDHGVRVANETLITYYGAITRLSLNGSEKPVAPYGAALWYNPNRHEIELENSSLSSFRINLDMYWTIPRHLTVDVSSQDFFTTLGTPPRIFLTDERASFWQVDNFVVTVTGTAPEIEITSPRETPEPSNWAMMLAGFAAIGTSLRRRRKVLIGLV